MNKFKTGIQLYTVRDPLAKDFKGTIEQLAKLGFNGVEFAFFYGNLEPAELADIIKTNKLEVCGIYEDMKNIANPESKVYAYAKALGCKYLTSGLGTPKTKQELDASVERCRKTAEAAKSQGMTLCYHAHAHEFAKIEGVRMLDYLLDNTKGLMDFEADTAWIKCGGCDPLSYIKQYADRIPLLHLKDVTEKNEITELGAGVIDFKSVIDFVKTSSIQWVSYEQDSTKLTPLESTKISIDYLKKLY